MKKEIKKQLNLFIIMFSFAFSVMLIIAGKTTVEEKSRQIIYGEKYESVFLMREKEVKEEETEASGKRLEKIISFSPLAPFYYFIKAVDGLSAELLS